MLVKLYQVGFSTNNIKLIEAFTDADPESICQTISNLIPDSSPATIDVMKMSTPNDSLVFSKGLIPKLVEQIDEESINILLSIAHNITMAFNTDVDNADWFFITNTD